MPSARRRNHAQEGRTRSGRHTALEVVDSLPLTCVAAPARAPPQREALCPLRELGAAKR